MKEKVTWIMMFVFLVVGCGSYNTYVKLDEHGNSIQKGDSIDSVMNKLGEPSGSSSYGETKSYTWSGCNRGGIMHYIPIYWFVPVKCSSTIIGFDKSSKVESISTGNSASSF